MLTSAASYNYYMIVLLEYIDLFSMTFEMLNFAIPNQLHCKLCNRDFPGQFIYLLCARSSQLNM